MSHFSPRPTASRRHLPFRSSMLRAVLLPPTLLLAGCMVVGTDYSAPDTITPDSWHQPLSRDLNSSSPSLETWWTRFNDPTLNNLIRKARDSNRDLAIAYERVTEARAARGIARSQLFPNVEFGGAQARNRSSENLGSPSPPAGKANNTWATGLDAGWEIDFFGGVRRSIEAADATVEGAEELYRDVLVSLLAEVAINYIQIRTLEERIRFAESNIKIQQGSVGLTTDRFDAGISSELDVLQATSNLDNTRAVIPQLKNQRSITVNRLATLIGRYPGPTETLLGRSKGIPIPPRSAATGIPADLVRARPDIRAAERQLAAQTALIGVAEADLYPRFTLAGTFQLQALNAPDVFQSGSRGYSFGPSFRWNIFSAGRIQSQIAIEESRTKQAFYNYQNAVLRGVEEVENAMASVRNESDRLAALESAVDSSRKTVSLVDLTYGEGLVDFQNVLDAQRTLFTSEDNYATSQGLISASYVALYKALGGGTPMKSSTTVTKDKS